jgi:hypothetical protein
LLGDFNHKGEYDLIIEQTFLRFTTGNASKISWKMHELLAKDGVLWFVFNRTFEAGPPFGTKRI